MFREGKYSLTFGTESNLLHFMHFLSDNQLRPLSTRAHILKGLMGDNANTLKHRAVPLSCLGFVQSHV